MFEHFIDYVFFLALLLPLLLRASSPTAWQLTGTRVPTVLGLTGLPGGVCFVRSCVDVRVRCGLLCETGPSGESSSSNSQRASDVERPRAVALPRFTAPVLLRASLPAAASACFIASEVRTSLLFLASLLLVCDAAPSLQRTCLGLREDASDTPCAPCCLKFASCVS